MEQGGGREGGGGGGHCREGRGALHAGTTVHAFFLNLKSLDIGTTAGPTLEPVTEPRDADCVTAPRLFELSKTLPRVQTRQRFAPRKHKQVY